MGTTRREISYKALNKLGDQMHKVLVAKTSRLGRLEPYTGLFRSQFGLPCAHELEDLVEANEVLTKDYVHCFWHLERNLEEERPILTVKDP